MGRAERASAGRTAASQARSADAALSPKKKISASQAWHETRELFTVDGRPLYEPRH